MESPFCGYALSDLVGRGAGVEVGVVVGNGVVDKFGVVAFGVGVFFGVGGVGFEYE